ncbi:MAG: TetR/AcrR family transcriptional regulator [Acidobacteriota bacterium]|nr:TetR/AcrR family transcriptional regulator [Blastocatellia bacterium]MDW8413121.1 TetR/AcrR family transcriptional regulator [Acidobacteriota bacterium]
MKEVSLRGLASTATFDNRRVRMTASDRRLQILAVAAELFSQRGFNGTTTKEIAKKAGVSEAVIFKHFATKGDLYSATLDYKAQEAVGQIWTRSLEAMKRKDDEAFFELLAAEILAFHQRDATLLRLLYYCALEGHDLAERFYFTTVKEARERIASYIAARIADGDFRRCDPDTAARLFLGLVGHCAVTRELFRWSDVRSTSIETAASEIVSVYLHGLKA